MDTEPEIYKDGLGYWGLFDQNSSVNEGSGGKNGETEAFGKILEFYTEKVQDLNWTLNDRVFRFVAIDSPPHVFVEMNHTHFNAWGPMFTLFVETVRFLNYSMIGAAPNSTNAWPAFGEAKPDVIVAPLWPQMQIFQVLVMDLDKKILQIKKMFQLKKLGYSSAFLGTIDLDYILYQQNWKTKSPFAFMTVFDTGVWFLLFLIPVFCALISSLKIQKQTRDIRHYFPYNQLFQRVQKAPKFFDLLADNIFFFLATLINSVPISFNRFSVRYLIVFWLLTVFVFVQFYQGELFSELTRNDSLKVIDSWNDLYRADQVLSIVAQSPTINYKKGVEDTYFNPSLPIAKDLAKRLQLIDFKDFYADDYIEDVTRSLVNDSETALMAPKGVLHYFLHHVDDGNYTEELHVSESGGYAQPYYMTSTFLAKTEKRNALAFVSERLIQAGIYQRIFDTTLFGFKPQARKLDLFASLEAAEFVDFIGVCYLTTICALLSIFCLMVETIFYGLVNTGN